MRWIETGAIANRWGDPHTNQDEFDYQVILVPLLNSIVLWKGRSWDSWQQSAWGWGHKTGCRSKFENGLGWLCSGCSTACPILLGRGKSGSNWLTWYLRRTLNSKTTLPNFKPTVSSRIPAGYWTNIVSRVYQSCPVKCRRSGNIQQKVYGFVQWRKPYKTL